VPAKAQQLDAKSFYDRLAPLFDVMTDWDSRLALEGPFLFQRLEQVEARKVLDAACGSGGHALALAKRGYQVVGTDASPAMIELARAKAHNVGNISFQVAPLGDLAARFSSFDAVLCLGNSLPHLLTEEELERALADLAACLRPGGLLITHNLNYDRRWKVRPRWFAVDSGRYQGHQVLVWRFADYVDAPRPRVDFHIAFFQQGEAGEWSVQVNSTPQRPLFHADLVRLLPAAGLDRVAYYGDLTGAPFVPDESPDLVVVAGRRG
jgi:glycine/sarcosine N-methyltransferase